MDWIRKRRPAPGTIFGLAALVIALGGVAVAAIPDSGGTIHGCYQQTGGNLRVVESAADCRNSERAISWNQQGPPGPPGSGSIVHAFGPVVVPLGQTATLARSGPFTFIGRCLGGFSVARGDTIVSTTEEHSAFDATPTGIGGGRNLDFGPTTPESERVMTERAVAGESMYFVRAPGGASLTGIVYFGDTSQERCIFGGHIVVGGSDPTQ